MDYSALFRVVVGDAVPLVCELFAAAVSDSGNGTSALASFNKFDAAMIDGRIFFDPLSIR